MKIFPMRYSAMREVLQRKINAPPTRCDSGGNTRFDAPVAPTDLALTERLIIARLSVTETIHRLSHGGVARAGDVSKLPKPVVPIAAVLPRLPSDLTVIRARRGAADSAAKKKNRLYTARWKKVMDAPRWLMGRTPYYADVVLGPSRLAEIVEGAEIPDLKDMNHGEGMSARRHGAGP